MKKITILLTTLAICISSAKITTPKVISDNMVLQRNEPVNIWGKSDSNANVLVKFGDITANTKADGNGNWILKLPSMPADKNPKDIEISENGKLDKTIKNVLVGEVWVAGGQSNMQMGVSLCFVYDKIKQRANYPLIRFFTQKPKSASLEPQWDSPTGAKWTVCSPETLDSFSAVAFFFSEKLFTNIDIPIAIIETPLNASMMCVWIARQDLENCDEFKKELDFYDLKNKTYDYKKELEIWEKKCEAFAKANKSKKPRKPRPMGFGAENRMPSNLYNAKIAPISNYTARGFLWYQGESDSFKGVETNNLVFTKKFTHLINSWRKYWNKPDMPFYFVQLTGFGDTTRDWPLTRWNQYLTTQKLKNVEMAVTTDLGEENQIHPRDKEKVSDRLSRIALQKIYGKSIVGNGPIFDSVTYDGNSCIVKYNTFDRKLLLKDEPKKIEVLCDGNWIPASRVSVEQDGRLIVNSDKKIDGVRYLWINWSAPYSCLFNSDGIPAMSFTDELSK